MLRLQSITHRLFTSFGILVVNIVIITLLALYYLKRSSDANELGERLEKQHHSIVSLINTDLDFLRFETVNIEYFRTRSSALLQRRRELLKKIRREQFSLAATRSVQSFIAGYSFEPMNDRLENYNQTFQTLLSRIELRGFKDFGVEGAMRKHAHALEERRELPIGDILMLRRHEKDFLLRHENQYIDKFNALANVLLLRLQNTHDQNTARDLSAYQREFNHLTQLSYEIGVTPRSGLLGTLTDQTTVLYDSLTELHDLVSKRKEAIIIEGGVWFGCVSLALIIVSCALTWFTSMRLARPIKRLSQSMGKFMVNEGLNEKEIMNINASDEIRTLSSSFIKMSRKLKSQFGEIMNQNRELKTLNEELDRFIYSAAHDLKSPLASLDGLIQLADREINSVQHRHYFEMMHSSVRKLNGFINDITDYAKNKRQSLVVERINLELLIRDVIDSLKFLPHANEIDVIVRVDGKEFYSDKTRLEIVLKNLIANSFRYADLVKSKPTVKIDALVNDQHLKLSIEDNGIGIGREHLGKIFQMFYRAVERSQGTGIGLFLVKESVKMLRGKIGVKSSLGEWTIFYLRLPNLRQGIASVPEPQDVIHIESTELFG